MFYTRVRSSSGNLEEFESPVLVGESQAPDKSCWKVVITFALFGGHFISKLLITMLELGTDMNVDFKRWM